MPDDQTGPIIEPTTSPLGSDMPSGLSSDPGAPSPISPTPAPSISINPVPASNDPIQPLSSSAPAQSSHSFIPSEPQAQTDIPASSPTQMPEPVQAPEPTTIPETPQPSKDDKDLLSIKQSALKELSPLVDELDLPPDEEFKTILMMIQSGDDKSLIPKAHEVASKIEDKKERAEALLDIVNEINYFTQQ